ncbi:hypothetical protein H6P81_021416 [Aristolochia fimbriata]|uniref:Uncharacterized protein n=1 Tax=Aristolochia fimbriata TaxID=158543 RepID=A0AAV7DRK5_ARIFI|nr:hypothetical protein H6P81_021416 [Aristolochia fimbriata]
MGLAPVRQRTLLQTTLNGRKAADSHTGLFPFAAATRGILRVFPPDLGSHPSKASGSRRQLPGRGPSSEPGPRTRLRATQGQGGRSHHSSCRSALGAKCFSANLARGGKDDHSARPRRLTADRPLGAAGHGWGEHAGRDAQADSMVRGILQFTPSIAISPRSSSMRAKISAVESRLGYRGSRSDRHALPFFALAQIAPKVVVRGVRPDRRWVADAEPAGRRVANARRGIRRALRLPPPPPLGIVVQLARLGRAAFAESTMILPQLVSRLRSRSLTELTRQIAPPTKNGHAPPPIESRKSSQSVNPYYVRPAPRHDPPVKARSDRRRRDEVDLCTPRGRTDDPTQAGITAAAGTGLALQWILAKGFRLYLFHYQTLRARYCYLLSLPPRVGLGNLRRRCLPLDVVAAFRLPPESNPNSPPPANTMDQPGSILSRDRDANNTPMRKAQHRARGIDGRKQKLGDQTRFANPTKSIGLPHSHGSMNTAGPGVPAHPGARLSRRGNDPTRPLEVRAVKGRRRDETTAHTAGSTTRACPTHHSHAPPSARPMPRPRMAKQQRRHRRRTGKSRSGEGAPNGPAESVKDQKTRVGQKGRAGHLGVSLRARRAEGHRPTEARGKWPLHCSHVEGQAIAQSARGATSPT